MNVHKLQNIYQLPAPKRYAYLVQKMADSQVVWLLRDQEGITMLSDDSGGQSIPVWPEKEFAQLHLTGDCAAYQTEEMSLEDFLEWLDELQEEMIQIAAFPKEDLQGIVVEAKEMKSHLLHELEQYGGSGKIAGDCYLDGCFRRLSPARSAAARPCARTAA
ncbi:DUF2750 domain-containing protein [Hymenobacter glacieicola]|uniref:DUF2750 domain-containing protein n=1 Tax=Hymenobacter glacieicola TaxID=1562124 RepID=A0ABQ1X8J3_9BACT|nr:DUF2750 domain-containing protein [Hymenobacter glacieicola]GGG61497.1 hypothetical protein GCM10011378_41900 [Hymenobacter glacieicola]